MKIESTIKAYVKAGFIGGAVTYFVLFALLTSIAILVKMASFGVIGAAIGSCVWHVRQRRTTNSSTPHA